MPTLKSLTEKVRSKNAGPFWVTIAIFCHADGSMANVARLLKTDDVARLFGVEPDTIKRFELADLDVIKLSIPRPSVQGTPQDRDMHGAAYACILEEFALPDA